MKQKVEFEIDVPDGKKAVWKDGKVVFEDIKPSLPKTWEKFCKQNKVKNGEYFLANDCSISEARKGERYTNADRNILPSKQAVEQHLTLMQLHQLRDCYRQGWKPNWTESTSKWVICKNENRLVVVEAIFYSEFLSFQSIKLAEEFLNNFESLIKQASDLI